MDESLEEFNNKMKRYGFNFAIYAMPSVSNPRDNVFVMKVNPTERGISATKEFSDTPTI